MHVIKTIKLDLKQSCFWFKIMSTSKKTCYIKNDLNLCCCYTTAGSRKEKVNIVTKTFKVLSDTILNVVAFGSK